MAVDALEYDESAEDANPAGALEEILENPERLKDLDLDAFAEELERQVSVCVCCGFDCKIISAFCCLSKILIYRAENCLHLYFFYPKFLVQTERHAR